MLTDDEKIDLGYKAETMLRTDDFSDLFEAVRSMISEEIIATPLQANDKREGLYLTFHGLRDFTDRLRTLVQIKDQIVQLREHRFEQYRSDDEGR